MIPNIVKGRGITGALAYVMGQGKDERRQADRACAGGKKPRAKFSARRISALRSRAPPTSTLRGG